MRECRRKFGIIRIKKIIIKIENDTNESFRRVKLIFGLANDFEN